MNRIKWPQMMLLNRIVLFLAAFGAAMALQIGIGSCQTKYVLEPLEKRSESIQSISEPPQRGGSLQIGRFVSDHAHTASAEAFQNRAERSDALCAEMCIRQAAERSEALSELEICRQNVRSCDWNSL